MRSELELLSDVREQMRTRLATKHVWSRNTVLEMLDEISIDIIDGQGKAFFDAVLERKREAARKAAGLG